MAPFILARTEFALFKSSSRGPSVVWLYFPEAFIMASLAERLLIMVESSWYELFILNFVSSFGSTVNVNVFELETLVLVETYALNVPEKFPIVVDSGTAKLTVNR